MTLSDHQWEFLLDLSSLIDASAAWGCKLTANRLKQYEGDVHWTPKSQHNKALAIDLNLFEKNIHGKWQYLSATRHHVELGQYWESLSPHNRWGGRYSDGNHYERLEVTRHEAPRRWGWFGCPQLWEDPMPDPTA